VGIEVNALNLPSSRTDTNITNSGKITASLFGIYATAGGAGDRITLVNNGSIDSAVAGIVAFTSDPHSEIAITNAGAITGGAAGIFAATGAFVYAPCGCIPGLPTVVPSGYGDNSPLTIVNSGVIDPTVGIQAATFGPNSPLLIKNSGSLSGDYAGILAVSYTSTTIVNTGDISAGSFFAIGVYGAPATIYNPGRITGFVDLTNSDDLFVNQS
jgi:hypothetical protein